MLSMNPRRNSREDAYICKSGMPISDGFTRPRRIEHGVFVDKAQRHKFGKAMGALLNMRSKDEMINRHGADFPDGRT